MVKKIQLLPLILNKCRSDWLSSVRTFYDEKLNKCLPEGVDTFLYKLFSDLKSLGIYRLFFE